MTNKRMNKLLCELNLPEGTVYMPDVENILKKCEKKIEKREKKAIRVISPSRVLAVAVIVILMLALSIVAFGKDGVIRKIITIFEEAETEQIATDEEKDVVFIIEEPEEVTEVPTEEETKAQRVQKDKSAIFEKYHQEDGEKAEEYIQEVYSSVEDNEFVMTLNEVMGDNKNVYLTVTIEAKTSEAREMLMNENHPRLAAEAYDEQLGWVGVSAGYEEAPNERREYSKTFTMHIFGDTRLTNGYEKMRITCKSFAMYMKDEEYVYFEIEQKKDVIEFALSGQSFKGGYFYITPMSIEITAPKEETDKYAPQAINMNTFFRFKNGMIKTFNQVAGFHGSFSKGEGDLYKYSAGTKNYLDLNTIESIIVKDVEYKTDNPSEYFTASVPDRLKPFIANDYRDENGYYYLCTLKELTDRMGVEYIYDADGILEYRYDGKVYRVEAGNGFVTANGETIYSLDLPPSLNQDGEIIVGVEFTTYVLGVRVGWIKGTDQMLAVP